MYSRIPSPILTSIAGYDKKNAYCFKCINSINSVITLVTRSHLLRKALVAANKLYLKMLMVPLLLAFREVYAAIFEQTRNPGGSV